MIVANIVNEGGAEPLTLYAGNRQERLHRRAHLVQGGGAGQVRSADDNPYTLYAKLVGLIGSGPGTGGDPTTDPVADELLAQPQERERPRARGASTASCATRPWSAADSAAPPAAFRRHPRRRGHDGRNGRASAAERASRRRELDALKSGLAFKTNGMIEDVAKLHSSSWRWRSPATSTAWPPLQHGDGTDPTKYRVPSNASLGWGFHLISHRMQSDAAVRATTRRPSRRTPRSTCVRMETLLHGLEQFKARGLFDKSLIMWTNHISDGPSHSFRNVPTIIAGNGGGYLKQGAYIDAGDVTNNRLLNGLIAAAVRDKTEWTENFGEGKGSGPIDGMLRLSGIARR